MSRFFFALRAGNFLRILLAMYVLVAMIVIYERPSTAVTIGFFLVATAVAVTTALVIGVRAAVVLNGWEDAALRAANEDFQAPMRRTVPSTWVPLRDALELSRDNLAASLSKAREEKAVLVSMLNAMTEGIIAIDSNTRILLVNRVALNVLGVPAVQSPEEYRGEHLVKLVRDPRFNELVDRVLATGRAMRDETEIHATRRVCSVSAAPIVEDGRVRGVVAAISDETMLKKLERVRQDFISNVSHELKTPVSAIRGWAEALHGGDFALTDELREPIEILYRQSDRLGTLVDDLMTLARVEAAGVEEEKTIVDIETVFLETKRALGSLISARSITLTADFAEDAHLFQTGGRAIRYIVRNLVDNAAKYSPEGGTVTVRTRRLEGGDEQVIEVVDEGQGIERHHLTRIFERFYRVDPGRSRELGGTGLGLSIVKNFATALGGRVEAVSEVGHGSTFRVTLPVPDEDVR